MFLTVPNPPVANQLWVTDFVEFFVDEFIPSFVNALSNMYLDVSVNLFSFLIAVALMCIVIGGILIK